MPLSIQTDPGSGSSPISVEAPKPGSEFPAIPAGILTNLSERTRLEVAAQIARELKEFLSQRPGLIAKFSGREYVLMPGWDFLALRLLGTCARIIDRPQRHEDGYVAHAVLEVNGIRIGEGWGLCDASERGKEGHSGHQLMAMAQTRARSRASRCLGWVCELAGYQPVAAEEVLDQKRVEKAAAVAPPPSDGGLSDAEVRILCRAAGLASGLEGRDAGQRWLSREMGKSLSELTPEERNTVIDKANAVIG